MTIQQMLDNLDHFHGDEVDAILEKLLPPKHEQQTSNNNNTQQSSLEYDDNEYNYDNDDNVDNDINNEQDLNVFFIINGKT